MTKQNSYIQLDNMQQLNNNRITTSHIILGMGVCFGCLWGWRNLVIFYWLNHIYTSGSYKTFMPSGRSWPVTTAMTEHVPYLFSTDKVI